MPKIIYDKPFKTFDEQLDYLHAEYDLLIRDRELCKKLLVNFSYYDLINGYKECFMVDNKYINDLALEDLYVFHIFDKNVQNILFKYSITVENKFKNILAYVISEKYDVDIDKYLNPKNFKDPKNIELRDVLNTLKEIPDSLNLLNPTKHYKTRRNHIPPWILFKNTNFNDCIDLLKQLTPEDLNAVSKLMLGDLIIDSYRNDFLINSLIIVRKFRNKIAHNLKFITSRTMNKRKQGNQILLKNMPSIYMNNLIDWKDFSENRGFYDPYAMVLSIITLLKEPYFFLPVISDLKNEFIKQQSTEYGIDVFYRYCDITNIPNDIISRFNLFENLFKSITTN